jgi:hypothetical protein
MHGNNSSKAGGTRHHGAGRFFGVREYKRKKYARERTDREESVER